MGLGQLSGRTALDRGLLDVVQQAACCSAKPIGLLRVQLKGFVFKLTKLAGVQKHRHLILARCQRAST